jgi:hypothetical protein
VPPKAAAQLLQNRAVSEFSEWHFGHFMTRSRICGWFKINDSSRGESIFLFLEVTPKFRD